MNNRAIQFYEDDIYGFVKFIDTMQQHHGVKATARHIKLVSNVSPVDRKTMRRAIAADINGE